MDRNPSALAAAQSFPRSSPTCTHVPPKLSAALASTGAWPSAAEEEEEEEEEVVVVEAAAVAAVVIVVAGESGSDVDGSGGDEEDEDNTAELERSRDMASAAAA